MSETKGIYTLPGLEQFQKPAEENAEVFHVGSPNSGRDYDENGDIIYLYNKPFIEDAYRVKLVSELAFKLELAGKPNAERYDRMTEDGTDFGHIAYPVVVFSKGRSHNATTPHLLDAARVQNWMLAVPALEGEKYQAAFPNADIILLQSDNIKDAREEISQQHRVDGYPFIWMLDDDVKEVSKIENGNWVKCSIRALLSSGESTANLYSNVSVLGFTTRAEDVSTKEFSVGEFISAMYLVNMQTGEVFNNPEIPNVFEMHDWIMRHPKHTTITLNHYAYEEANLGGGLSKMYLEGEKGRAVNVLVSRYPLNFSEGIAPAPFYKELIVEAGIEIPLMPNMLAQYMEGEKNA